MLTTEVTVTDLPEEKKEAAGGMGGHDHGTGSQGMTRSKAQRIFLRAFFWGEDHWQNLLFYRIKQIFQTFLKSFPLSLI